MLPITVTRPVAIQEISIALDARDTKVGVGRELTNGNPFSVRLFENGNRADYPAARSTIAEPAPTRNWGRRFEIMRISR